MKKLIETAKNSGIEAEVLKKKRHITSIGYQDGKLEAVTKKMTEGFSFRIIKNGRLGAVYGSHLKGRKKILAAAMELSKSGNKVNFHFSDDKTFPNLKLHSRKTKNLEVKDLIETGDELRERLSELTDIKPDISISSSSSTDEVGTTHGTHGKYKNSNFTSYISLPIPSSAGSVSEHLTRIKPGKFKKKELKRMVKIHRLFSKNFTPATGNLPVIFTPNAFMWLIMSFLAGISGSSLVKGISPLNNKINEQIFSDKISILDNPVKEKNIHSVPFDDEGVKTTKKFLVEKGVLKNFIFDLATGAKMGKESTGNGFKAALFGASISTPPTPMSSSIEVLPGNLSDRELIRKIDKGLYIDQVLGFHSGNYTQGQFSVSVGVGLYIKHGRLKGRLVDTMLAGNIYEILNRVIGISNNAKDTYLGKLPWIALDNIKVSGK